MIEIIDLKKSFGKTPVLQGVNLTIRDDETMVIIGPSGCGKSVLLKHIIGLLRPDSGHLIIDGEDTTGFNERQLYKVRERFGMLFQAAALFESMTAGENVGLWIREHTDMPEDQVQANVSRIFNLIGLKGAETKRPSELSGGMKKRVGLARAIIHNPKFLLYDEPTTGLDPIMSDIINDLILRIRAELKNTAIVVTHDMVSVFKVADRIAMLHKGKIIFLGTPEEIKQSEDERVQQFIHGKAKGPISL
ncbi:MAG: ABC transporter ATP-binding protein [Spirochaetia bacterium]|nr:ABC transporter ATP-binding protein [Spirochaetia bacterium]